MNRSPPHVRARSRVPGLLLLTLLASCEGTVSPPGPPDQVAAASPASLTGTVGTALPDPLVVEVVDARGKPVPNVTVTWQATPDAGSLAPREVVTDEQGLARSSWTLGTQAGSQTVHARVVTTQGPLTVEFAATAQPGPAATGIVQATEPRVLMPGEQLRLTATFKDRYGNIITGRNPAWTSSNRAIAEVDGSGVVTGRGGGTAVITASLDEARAELALVGGPLRFGAVSAGKWSCGLTTEGQLLCWSGTSPTPVPVPGAPAFATISVGIEHACGVTAAGRAYCWGNNNWGQLGNGATTTTPSSTPVPVEGGLTFAGISAGYYHTCGVTTGGAAYCWGRNDRRQLGTGTAPFTNRNPSPLPVAGGLAFRAVSAQGWLHTCGLGVDGTGYCWGYNGSGQLGTGKDPWTLPDALAPTPVTGGLSFTSITTAYRSSCGTTASGEIYCWGSASEGALGTDSVFTTRCSGSLSGHPCTWTPVRVEGDQSWQGMDAYTRKDENSYFRGAWACGLAGGGRAYCWGHGARDVVPTDSRTPVPVAGGLSFARLDAGEQTCGLATDGILYCWTTGPPERVVGQ